LPSDVTPAHSAFFECIKGFKRVVDDTLCTTVPWQLWEWFGAYFHALRINAHLILGTTSGKFSDLIAPGSMQNGCDD
jgi:hypothetical protein